MLASQVYSIKQTANLFKAQIDQSDNAYCDYIKKYAEKNFAYSIRLAGGFVIYPREKDRSKRRFFLDCLITNFNKNRKSKIFFNTEKSLPILVEFIADASKLKDTFIYARMTLGCVSFRIYNPSNKIYETIETLYRPEKKEINHFARLIKIVAISPTAVQKTKELLTRGLKIDDTYVRFIYSEEELASFCRDSNYDKGYFIERYSDASINAHFQTLNSAPGDSFDKVKKSYMKLAKEFHPDNVYGKDAQTVRNYTQRFQLIQSAFESIKSHYEQAI